MKKSIMAWILLIKEILPGISQFLLGVAAVISALKGRKTAKEIVNEKRKD